MTRIARCCCGKLHAEKTGGPAGVAACHCTACQRRIGAAFAVNAYFRNEQVRIAGESRVYVRAGEEGRKVRIHFCPHRGSSVRWDADFLPRHNGVAYGAFADASLPPTSLSAWKETRHPWAAFGHALDNFPRAVVSPSAG